MLIIVAEPRQAEALWLDLLFFRRDASVPVLYFPPYNIQPYKVLAYHNETAARRLKVLYTLLDAVQAPIVVTTVGAFLKRLIPKDEVGDYAELLMIGEDVDRTLLVEKLVDGGYTHAHIVEEPGDFSVRGGILDVFCPLYENPLRVEFFGDTIESLRFFSADSQRKLDEVEEAVVLPAREAVLPGKRLAAIISRIRLQVDEQQLPKHEARHLIGGIKEDRRFPGIESLMPLIYPRLDTLLDYMTPDALVVEIEPAELEKAALDVLDRAEQHYQAALQDQKLGIDPARQYLSWDEAETLLTGARRLRLRQLPIGKPAMPEERLSPLGFEVQDIDLPARSMAPAGAGDHSATFRALADWLLEQMQQGLAVHLVCRNANQMERVGGLLEPYGIDFERASGIAKREDAAP